MYGCTRRIHFILDLIYKKHYLCSIVIIIVRVLVVPFSLDTIRIKISDFAPRTIRILDALTSIDRGGPLTVVLRLSNVVHICPLVRCVVTHNVLYKALHKRCVYTLLITSIKRTAFHMS